jgi:hypothetical protein
MWAAHIQFQMNLPCWGKNFILNMGKKHENLINICSIKIFPFSIKFFCFYLSIMSTIPLLLNHFNSHLPTKFIHNIKNSQTNCSVNKICKWPKKIISIFTSKILLYFSNYIFLFIMSLISSFCCLFISLISL